MALHDNTSMYPEDEAAKQNRSLYRKWRDARGNWDIEARSAFDFIMGSQYTAQESADLQAIGQGDFTLDRISSAFDRQKSLLTARTPKFLAVPREDSDSQIANVWRTILEYIWDVSKGGVQFRQAVSDYAVYGLGYLYAYLDVTGDYGRGEIKFKAIDPFRVYVPPSTRDRFFSDASSMILSTIATKEQLLGLYPVLRDKIDNINAFNNEEDFPTSQQKNTAKTFSPAEVKDLGYGDEEKYQILERFTKIYIDYYRIVDKSTRQERILDEEGYNNFIEQNGDLLESGTIDVIRVPQKRVRIIASVGQVKLYEAILNSDEYPIVPIANIWTNTPYPKSNVTKVKDAQRLMNKVFSLILSHAQSAAGLKLLIPEGSSNIEEVRQMWQQPNAVIPYNPEEGKPEIASPQPLSGEFYAIIDRIEHYMDLSFGVPELMHGISPKGGQPFRTTALMAEFSEGRGKSKLQDIEGSLEVLGKVLYNLGKAHYTFEKKFRIVQPNNNVTEFAVNSGLLDDKTNALIAVQNDITVGEYDIKIVTGSTLPSNRIQEYELYKDAFSMGLIDDVEVLKKTEIFDKEGVLKRKGEKQRLIAYIKELEGNVKNLTGDLQTASRAEVSSRKRVEVEKFTSKLNKILNETEADKKIGRAELISKIDRATRDYQRSLETSDNNREKTQ